jgi:hypothetical protein
MPNKKIDSPTPENAKEYADLIVKIAKKNSNVDLDYSPSSLIDVDEIIEGFRQDGQSSDQIYQSLFSFGCYVGEVFIRNAGGTWRESEKTQMKGAAGSPLVVELTNGSIVNPVGKVIKRMDNGEVDSIPYFYEVFASETIDSNVSIQKKKKGWEFWKK